MIDKDLELPKFIFWVWALGVLLSLSLIGVIIWAVVKLVLYFTRGG